MEMKYDQVPDLDDKTKWMELEVKREPIYGNSGNLIVPIGETRYHREINNNKMGSGVSISMALFEQKPCLISWNYTVANEKTGKKILVGYIALCMKNGKWAISNLTINGISIEKDSNILHLHIYEKEVWIFLKAKKGWAIRKIKKSS